MKEMTEKEKIQQDLAGGKIFADNADSIISIQRTHTLPEGEMHILVGKPKRLHNALIAEITNRETL